MPGKQSRHRRGWWTRDRMLDAGARFYREHGVAPTNEGWWHSLTQFTADAPGGVSNQGHLRPYPSTGPLKKYWKGMRDFWADVAGRFPQLSIRIDAGDMPWSPLEEWWITETVGLLTRDEVSRLMYESGMGRTEPAIKRRLYEMGVNSYNRWGITLNHIERLTGVSQATIQKYIAHGALPYFRGAKCIYVDPADLTVVSEYDWSKKRQPKELDRLVRSSLARRLCYALLRFDWRRFSYHRVRTEEEYFDGRPVPRRQRVPKLPAEPKPEHVKVGSHVRLAGEWRFKTPGAKDRVGVVKAIFWSPQRRRATQKSPARPACWVANVELPRVTKHGRPNSEYPRTHYNVPVCALEKVRKPYERKKELKPRRPREKRAARLKAAGAAALNNRLRAAAGGRA
jgi:hypothetical protein